MRNSIRKSALAGLSAGMLLLTTSCNIFAFMDSPGDNEEYLSMARACFDDGDVTCAREYYGKLAGGAYDNIRESELAYVILYEYGIDMKAFMRAFGEGGNGSGLTSMTNSILDKIGTPTITTRMDLWQAYNAHNNITGDPELAGLVQFLGAMAFAAHVLAENANGTFGANDYVADPVACQSEAACALAPASCDTTTALDSSDGGDITVATSADTVPGLDLFNSAMQEVNAGLSAIGAGGGFSETSGFAQALLAAGVDHCYRQAMLQQGIGF